MKRCNCPEMLNIVPWSCNTYISRMYPVLLKSTAAHGVDENTSKKNEFDANHYVHLQLEVLRTFLNKQHMTNITETSRDTRPDRRHHKTARMTRVQRQEKSTTGRTSPHIMSRKSSQHRLLRLSLGVIASLAAAAASFFSSLAFMTGVCSRLRRELERTASDEHTAEA